jgi:hypothetical protein
LQELEAPFDLVRFQRFERGIASEESSKKLTYLACASRGGVSGKLVLERKL